MYLAHPLILIQMFAMSQLNLV